MTESVVDRLLTPPPPTPVEEAAENSVVDRLIFDTSPAIPHTNQPRVPKMGRGIQVEPATTPGGFWESFKQGFIDDPMTRIRRHAQRLFPDDPEAIDRFGIVGGNIVFVNDEGNLERASGGLRDAAGNIMAYAPEVAGAVVGSAATVPFTGTAAPMTGGALGAAGGRGFKDLIGGLFLDDPTTPMGVLTAMGTEFALDFVAGAPAKGLQVVRRSQKLDGLDKKLLDQENLREFYKRHTGIELDLAQVAKLPKLKALKTWVRNFPGEAAETVRAMDELQKGQIEQAVDRVVRTVSASSDAARQGIDGINAAQAAIAAARMERAAVTGPMYETAFNSGAVPRVRGVVDYIDGVIDSAAGKRKKQLKKVRELFFENGELIEDMRKLHDGVKIEIDDILDGSGKSKAAKSVRRDLSRPGGVKDQLLDALSAASPEYDEARRAYEFLSENYVTPLTDGVVGVLAELKRPGAAKAAAKMFNGGDVTPEDMARARLAITQTEGGEEAWNGLVRQWLDSQMNLAAKELQTGETGNLAGKFRQRVVGTKRQQQAMQVALGDDARELFNITMEALQYAASTPTASSATEFNRLITNELSGIGNVIKRRIMSPLDSTLTAADEKWLQRNALLVSEALTDPAKKKNLITLAQIPPSRERAEIVASVIGLSILPRDAAGNLLFSPDDFLPPAVGQQ